MTESERIAYQKGKAAMLRLFALSVFDVLMAGHATASDEVSARLNISRKLTHDLAGQVDLVVAEFSEGVGLQNFREGCMDALAELSEELRLGRRR